MSTGRVKKIASADKWITQTEAAQLRKVTPAAIARLIRRGRLKSKIINGRKMVFYEDVIIFKPAPGRPSTSVMQAAIASLNREEWITIKEAAKLREITTSGIRTAIERGRVRFLKKGEALFANKQDVLNYRPRIDFHPESGPQSALPSGANPKEWITVAEAARIRDVNQATITGHVTSKRIRSIKTGNTRLIYREDVVNFKRKPRTVQKKK